MFKRLQDKRIILAGMVFLLGFFILPSFSHASILAYHLDTPTSTIGVNGPVDLGWNNPTGYTGDLYVAIQSTNFENINGAHWTGSSFSAGGCANASYGVTSTVATNNSTLGWNSCNSVPSWNYASDGKYIFFFSGTTLPATDSGGHLWNYYITPGVEMGIYFHNSNSGNYSPTTFANVSSTVGSEDLPYDCITTTLADAQSCFTSGPPAPSPTISFLYPTEGITTTAFSAFAMGYNNLIATHTYQTDITYSVPQITGEKTLSFTDTGANIGTARLVPIPSGPGSYINQSSVNEIANASLYDVTNFLIPDTLSPFLIATTSVEYNVLVNGTALNATTSFTNVFIIGSSTIETSTILNPIQYGNTPITTSTFALQCAKPSDWTDFGGDLLFAGCGFLNVAILPQAPITSVLEGEIQGFQNIFPFSLYFGIVNPINTTIQNTASSSNSSPTALNLEIMDMNGNYFNLGSITSSTLLTVLQTPKCNLTCAQQAVGNYFGVADMLIWTTAGIKIVLMIAKGI